MDESHTELNIDIGKRICQRREELSITQEEIARKLGMSGEEFAQVEAGQAILSTRRLLSASEILAVPVLYFFRQAHGDIKFLQDRTLNLETEDASQLARVRARADGAGMQTRLSTLLREIRDQAGKADDE